MTAAAPVTDQTIRDILGRVRRIALVGASANPERPSNRVFRFLLDKGYDVVGIHPGRAGLTLHGAPVYGKLSEVPGPIDMVDIFRRAEDVGPVVAEALQLSPKPSVIWMQLGIVNEEAAEEARAAGLDVVMNRCPAIEMPRLSIAGPASH